MRRRKRNDGSSKNHFLQGRCQSRWRLVSTSCPRTLPLFLTVGRSHQTKKSKKHSSQSCTPTHGNGAPRHRLASLLTAKLEHADRDKCSRLWGTPFLYRRQAPHRIKENAPGTHTGAAHKNLTIILAQRFQTGRRHRSKKTPGGADRAAIADAVNLSAAA